jgi:hypothetical protein
VLEEHGTNALPFVNDKNSRWVWEEVALQPQGVGRGRRPSGPRGGGPTVRLLPAESRRRPHCRRRARRFLHLLRHTAEGETPGGELQYPATSAGCCKTLPRGGYPPCARTTATPSDVTPQKTGMGSRLRAARRACCQSVSMMLPQVHLRNSERCGGHGPASPGSTTS